MYTRGGRSFLYASASLAAAFLITSFFLKELGEAGFPGNSAVYELINSNQLVQLNSVMVFLSKYGREYVWIPFTTLMFGLGGKFRRSSLNLISAFIVSIVLGEISKRVMAEPRPFLILHHYHLLLQEPLDYSYPSGHALIVSAGAVVVLLTLPYYISIPMTIEALAVSYSRVYVGAHWPIDVIGGWLLGSSIALVSLYFSPLEEVVYRALISPFSRIRHGGGRAQR
jgi:membrane-associated phospholipid phosphatase